MIAVVADDFTGAAEVAAVGWRYGLNAEVQTVFNPRSKADLVVIDTDTRSRAPQQAATEVKKALGELQKTQPEWIYKKVDSVLRGPVVAELKAALACLGKDRIMLVPENPSLGRLIRDGRYIVNGRALDESDFADDPEHPATSSDVLELLSPSRSTAIRVLQHPQAVPAQTIVVGEAQSRDDLLAWAEQLDTKTIGAGAAEFFAALLEIKGFRRKTPDQHNQGEPQQHETSLFICAGSSDYSRRTVRQAQNHGVPVSTMPPELLQTDILADELLQQWADDTIAAIAKYSRVIVAVDEPIGQNLQLAQKLRGHIAALVDMVLGKSTVNELYIEGGTTASAIVRRLQWTRFSPCCELAPGVVRLRVAEKQNQYLTVKPGSYCWSDKIWRFK